MTTHYFPSCFFKSTGRVFIVLIALICFRYQSFAQAPVTYPRITGYVGIIHPIVTFGNNGPTYNFNGAYVVGMPVGINIWKTAKVGFSMEFVPFIRAADGTSKMNNLLFHPGALFALGKGFTFASRIAFETSGRYGFTPVLTKTVIRKKLCSFYVSGSLPARFGNEVPSSVAIALQVGIAF